MSSLPLNSGSLLMKELKFHRGLVSSSTGGAVELFWATDDSAFFDAGNSNFLSSFDSSLLDSDSLYSDDDEEDDRTIGDIIAGVGDGGLIEATLGGLKRQKTISLKLVRKR